MLTAHIIHEHSKETATYKCSLTYAERFLRRKRLETDCGISFVLDLEKTTNLNHGDHIELRDTGYCFGKTRALGCAARDKFD